MQLNGSNFYVFSCGTIILKGFGEFKGVRRPNTLKKNISLFLNVNLIFLLYFKAI